MIRVFNTLSKTKETFQPVRSGKVGIYLCGPTVYKPSHIGHMVGPVIFDTIKRYLVYNGFDVTLVINVTDVDDKLIVESTKRGISMAELAEEMTVDYMNNLDAMGVDSVDHFPKATDNIDQIVRFTSDLIDQGFAYASDGDVYFDVSKCAEYGKLSHRALDSMQGEGGETAQRKRSSADFALWKSAKPDEPSWESPWGPGRPGWHIECSAMSGQILGETFDIHGGGLDLVFPHHENEIAQSESRHRKPMAKYWMHNGLMQASDEVGKLGGRNSRATDQKEPNQQEQKEQVQDQKDQEAGKISKSKGANAFRDMLLTFAPETIRFFLLSTHYRRPIDYSETRLREVETGMDTFYRFFKRYERITGESFYHIHAPDRRESDPFEPGEDVMLQAVFEQRSRFLDAMDDDFNTGGAIGDLFELVRRLNKYVDDEKLEVPGTANGDSRDVLEQGAQTLRELAATLGLFRQPPETASSDDDQLVAKLMELLIEVRAEARKTKNFATADTIRNSLTELGITLEDRPGGTEWVIGDA